MNKKYVWIVFRNGEVWKLFLTEESAEKEIERVLFNPLTAGAEMTKAAYRVAK